MRPSILYRKKMRNQDDISGHEETSHLFGRNCISPTDITLHIYQHTRQIKEFSKPNKRIKL